MKWSRLTSREMLRQSRNLLAFNALLLSIVLVWINEPGFASEKLCVVIALSENKHQSCRQVSKPVTIRSKMPDFIQNDLHVNFHQIGYDQNNESRAESPHTCARVPESPPESCLIRGVSAGIPAAHSSAGHLAGAAERPCPQKPACSHRQPHPTVLWHKTTLHPPLVPQTKGQGVLMPVLVT